MAHCGRHVLAALLVLAGLGGVMVHSHAQVTTCEVVEGKKRMTEARVKAIESKAEDGFATAQYELGCLYRWGIGVKRDPVLALDWFLKATDQDDRRARHEIVDMYKTTQGFSGQLRMALALREKQALEGDADAQYMMGLLYLHGLGVEPSYEKAAEYLEMSAAQDNVNAKARLGGLYARGDGVNQDYARALALGAEAAKAGHVMAMINVGRMYETGTGVPQDMVRARQYYEQAAAKDNRVAQALLKELDMKQAAPADAAAAGNEGRSSGSTSVSNADSSAEQLQ